jgi:hypothetical protein
MEPVGMASRDGGLRATDALDSVAPTLPTHAPAPAAAPMEFVQVLLQQSVLMGPPGGVAKRGPWARLPLRPWEPLLR